MKTEQQVRKRRRAIKRYVGTAARKLIRDDYARCGNTGTTFDYYNDPELIAIVTRLVNSGHRAIDIPRAAFVAYCAE